MPTRPIEIRKHDLEIMLQKVGPHPRPNVGLEQYTTPADLAAEILFSACYFHDDIRGKSVLDLGTGTGRLAIGASILGANYVVGVDVDEAGLRIASAARNSLRAQVDFVLGEIAIIHGPVDTVLMNPPFGTRKAHADLHFLDCALRVGDVVYSIHKSSTRQFLRTWLRNHGFNHQQIVTGEIEIPHQYSFHRKPKGSVAVDIIRVSR